MIIPLVVAFVVLLGLAAPVSIAMGLASAIAILWGGKAPINTVVTQMVAGMDSFPLMAIPFFILAGELMERAGISERLVHLAKTMVGHIKGGLGIVVLVGEYLFSGISGSTAADVSAIGSLPPTSRPLGRYSLPPWSGPATRRARRWPSSARPRPWGFWCRPAFS
ncbi:MAG: rane protein [Holophagaceae bacterium]|nr:rane protein [Holophagaceae bacterium]